MNRVLTFVVSCVVVALVAASPAVLAQASKAEKKVQQAKLTFDDKGYVVTPSSLVNGVPVKMEVDLQTVKGCMRTVVIDAFKVKKTVKEGDTTIEFTPSKTGEIPVVCGMNMGKGSFKVVNPPGAR